MKESARIRLVKGSKQETVTLQEVKEALERYRETFSLTGRQLDWSYQDAAFPYEVEEREQSGSPFLFLKGTDPRLHHGLVIGVGRESEEGPYFIQVVLPGTSTHGDKAKANEFCKYLARTFKGELHLFNGRIMYFNDRKG
ncbi:DUF1885 family protein [Staphylospora marina]|uniref:DUF1885 family protein n=1 Tax=Staphylospora marina TaxID=2490858 RepID=UPI000F5B9254|nr:DUF1885 family protein [Staphylospora marina]